MSQRHVDPTHRFSTRVENYVRYRPGYPADVLRMLADEMGFSPVAVVADVGAGRASRVDCFSTTATRFTPSSRTDRPDLARRPRPCFASPRFHSVIGTAEQTTLADQTVDYIVAGQAFHWFDIAGAGREVASHLLIPGVGSC